MSKLRKFLFIAMGPGETSQGRAVALVARDQGHRVVFAVRQAINLPLISRVRGIEARITSTPKTFLSLVTAVRPHVIFLCNSKMWGEYPDFQNNAPHDKPLTVSLDSNWLFNRNAYPGYPCVQWIDRHFITMPPSVFKKGLIEAGGHFDIPSATRKKIVPVGFIPSNGPLRSAQRTSVRKMLGIGKKGKLIFSYFSGYGAGYRSWVRKRLLLAVIALRKKGRDVNVFSVNRFTPLQDRGRRTPWLSEVKRLDPKRFYEILAASDLVFQHQGLATLSESVSARIPVIANVAPEDAESIRDIHLWETEPFERKGLAKVLTPDVSLSGVTSSIEDLLFVDRLRKEMKARQEAVCIPGEKKMLRIIEEMLS